MDLDGNGYIEFEEFMTAAMNRKTMVNEENLKIAFNAFDRGGDGKITAEELKFVIGDK